MISSPPIASLQSQFLTPARLAWVLDVCEETILREIKRKRIEATKVGRTYRVSPESALEYLKRSAVRANGIPAVGSQLVGNAAPGEAEEVWRRIERLIQSAVQVELRRQPQAA
jgi:excisionase family DNA binding protein